MRVLIIIPARSASKRFPEKPLAKLTSPDGVCRPLIEWTWIAACKAVSPEQVIIATDCPSIAKCAAGFGANAVMTSPDLLNGTERCAAVLDQLPQEPDLVINLQGDSPLIPPEMIHQLIARFDDRQVSVATPYIVCDEQTENRLTQDAENGRVGGTCVVTDNHDRALYFSKYPVPFGGGGAENPLKMHLGVYAFRPASLRAYLKLPASALELAEGLEQLRFLAGGQVIHMVEVSLPEGGIWEVNRPEDIAVVEAVLPKRNI